MRKLMSNWRSDLIGLLWVGAMTAWLTSLAVGNIYWVLPSSMAMLLLARKYINTFE